MKACGVRLWSTSQEGLSAFKVEFGECCIDLEMSCRLVRLLIKETSCLRQF